MPLNIALELKNAVRLHERGDLNSAKDVYKKILSVNPNQPDALHLLGYIAYQTGHSDSAVTIIGNAIKLSPQNPVFYNNHGLALKQLGNLTEAIEEFRQALSLQPNMVEAYNNMGLTLQQQGKLNEALFYYTAAIDINGNIAEIHNNMGNALRETGNQSEAINAYQKAISLDNKYAEAYCNIGTAFKDRGNMGEALTHYKKAIQLKPDFAEAYFNIGNILSDNNRLEEAIVNYRFAIRINQEYAEAYNNLGTARKCQGNSEEAINNYKMAIKFKPDYFEAYSNLATQLIDKGLTDEAAGYYKRSVEINPLFAEGYYNLGSLFRLKGMISDSINMYDKAIKIRGHYIDAHWNRAIALLLSGNLTNGWQEYEWRLKDPNWRAQNYQTSSKPIWDGSSFEGKRLLVYCEQGLGDAIQFIRFMPMVKSRGGTVILKARKPLFTLLNNFPGIDELYELSEDNESVNNCDLQVYMMSLPGIFGVTLDNIPAKVPYVSADSEKAGKWKKRLSGDRFKIGLVWAGRPEHKNDDNRSCPLKHFVELGNHPEIKLYGLQKGKAAGQAKLLTNEIDIENIGDDFADFSDTAAAIQNLDMIISVDTSVAHLAGAMGKPVWLLLPSILTDWRWLNSGEDSRWYPTMRIFRQGEGKDWNDVINDVMNRLSLLLKNYQVDRQKVADLRFYTPKLYLGADHILYDSRLSVGL